MTKTDTAPPAGADYWFDQAAKAAEDGHVGAALTYLDLADRADEIDRLADDECPIDAVREAAEIEYEAALSTVEHYRTCAAGVGPHPFSECPA